MAQKTDIINSLLQNKTVCLVLLLSGTIWFNSQGHFGKEHVPGTANPGRDTGKTVLTSSSAAYLTKQQQLGHPNQEGLPKLALTHSVCRTEVTHNKI